MSLSKVYKNTSSFVPGQILKHQERQGSSFEQDTAITPTALPARNLEHADQSPSNPVAAPDEDRVTAAPAIDVEAIREKAFAEGVLQGRQQADEDFGTCARTLRAACSQLNNLHETILRNNIKEMHLLVMEIAEKIIRHSIAEQSETVLATIQDAIRLAVKSDDFQIRVNPDDLETIKQKKKEIIDEINGLDNIVLKSDNSVERGGCLLESTNCTVDANITSQLQVIREALQSEPLSLP